VVADDDVLLSSRIVSTLKTLGFAPLAVRTADAFQEALAAAPAAAIVNLAAHRFDAIAAIRRAKGEAPAREVPLLGFCGHMDEARRRSAREAGCDLVATNGAVAAGLGDLLRSLLAGSDNQPVE
jgi:DNA-binding response OmpR family regulator